MKRDLCASSDRCRKFRIRCSAICSILGIALVLFGLTWIEGSSRLRNQPTLGLLSVSLLSPGAETALGQKEIFEVRIAPGLFGGDARFGLPLTGSSRGTLKPLIETSKATIRLASMEEKSPSRRRTGKS
jgi:hypothetical protein